LRRRRVIAPSIAPSRIFFNKPAGSLVCRAKKERAAQKSACLMSKKAPKGFQARTVGLVRSF